MMKHLNFKEFYYSQHPEQKQIQQTISQLKPISETVRIKENRDILSNKEENLYIAKTVIDEGLHIDEYDWNGNKLGVYEYDFIGNSDSRYFYFISVSDSLTVVKFEIQEQSNKVKIVDVNSVGGFFSRIVPDIYVNWLLSKYDGIISDDHQTDQGFGIYRFLLKEQERFGINVSVLNKKTNEKIPVSDISELVKYFGSTVEFYNYLFLIEKK